MHDLRTAIDLLAAEDPASVPTKLLAQQLADLHWQMARLQAQIARRTSLRTLSIDGSVSGRTE